MTGPCPGGSQREGRAGGRGAKGAGRADGSRCRALRSKSKAERRFPPLPGAAGSGDGGLPPASALALLLPLKRQPASLSETPTSDITYQCPTGS